MEIIVIPIKVGTSHQSEKLGFTTVQPNLPVSFLLGITINKLTMCLVVSPLGPKAGKMPALRY
jgi:hypothetical protein